MFVDVLNYKQKTMEKNYDKKFEDVFNLLEIEESEKISKAEVIYTFI